MRLFPIHKCAYFPSTNAPISHPQMRLYFPSICTQYCFTLPDMFFHIAALQPPAPPPLPSSLTQLPPSLTQLPHPYPAPSPSSLHPYPSPLTPTQWCSMAKSGGCATENGGHWAALGWSQHTQHGPCSCRQGGQKTEPPCTVVARLDSRSKRPLDGA